METGGVAPALDQSSQLVRTQVGVTLGLPVGLQFGVSIPLDLKNTTSTWSVNGSPYQPTWDGFDHSDGLAFGPGDVRLWFGIADAPVGVGGLLLGVWGGASVPTGRPPDDPSTRGFADDRRREFGSGTFAPMLRTMVFWTSANFGVFASGEVRATVYATPKGYRASSAVAGSVGPTLMLPAPLDKLRLRLMLDTSFLTPEAWHGTELTDSGRATAGVTMGATVQLAKKASLDFSLSTRAYELIRGNQFQFPLTAGIGFTAFAGPPKKAPPK